MSGADYFIGLICGVMAATIFFWLNGNLIFS